MAFTRRQKTELHTRIKQWFEQLLGSELTEEIGLEFAELGFKYGYDWDPMGGDLYDGGLWVAWAEDEPTVTISLEDDDGYYTDDMLRVNWGVEGSIRIPHNDSMDLVMQQLEINKRDIKETVEMDLENSIRWHEEEEALERAYQDGGLGQPARDYGEEEDDVTLQQANQAMMAQRNREIGRGEPTLGDFPAYQPGTWQAFKQDANSQMFVRGVELVLSRTENPHILKMLPADEKEAIIAKLQKAIENLSEASAEEQQATRKPKYAKPTAPGGLGHEIIPDDEVGLEIDEAIVKRFGELIKG